MRPLWEKFFYNNFINYIIDKKYNAMEAETLIHS